jgi:hypothetical protein
VAFLCVPRRSLWLRFPEGLNRAEFHKGINAENRESQDHVVIGFQGSPIVLATANNYYPADVRM